MGSNFSKSINLLCGFSDLHGNVTIHFRVCVLFHGMSFVTTNRAIAILQKKESKFAAAPAFVFCLPLLVLPLFFFVRSLQLLFELFVGGVFIYTLVSLTKIVTRNGSLWL